MSAGFVVADEGFWGSTGAIESYVAALAAHAGARFGLDDALASFLREELEGFFPGKIVVLDAWLRDATARTRFLSVLNAATEQLLREGAFTQYGQQWIATVINRLRERIAGGGL